MLTYWIEQLMYFDMVTKKWFTSDMISGKSYESVY